MFLFIYIYILIQLQYEAEYERLLELRRASLSSFILSTRSTIVALQTSLLMSPRSQSASFPEMHDEEYTEDLLHLHEKQVERLEEEVESKKNILPKVREWFRLVEDEEELERNERDPNRFSRRGGAMLREEKLRKRVNVLKPKIEMDLLSLLPTWEEENGRPFMVSGRRVVDQIHDAMEEKELVKEAKKVNVSSPLTWLILGANLQTISAPNKDTRLFSLAPAAPRVHSHPPKPSVPPHPTRPPLYGPPERQRRRRLVVEGSGRGAGAGHLICTRNHLPRRALQVRV